MAEFVEPHIDSHIGVYLDPINLEKAGMSGSVGDRGYDYQANAFAFIFLGRGVTSEDFNNQGGAAFGGTTLRGSYPALVP
jgi:hypothetical protein